MKRRNFIKNTGLGIAGLSLSNNIFSKNIAKKNNLHIFILMNGGVRYNDIINAQKNNSTILFQEEFNLQVKCKTKVQYNGDILEHENTLITILSGINAIKDKKIFIGNINACSTKAVKEAHLSLEIITTVNKDNNQPFGNDAAVFEMASKYLKPEENTTLILNLEDTDIAHFNAAQYNEVLNYYDQQINALCQKIYSTEYNQIINAKLTVASLLGRNNYDNELCEMLSGSDHYDESARTLFCFETSAAKNYQLIFDHSDYDIKDLFIFPNNMAASDKMAI